MQLKAFIRLLALTLAFAAGAVAAKPIPIDSLARLPAISSVSMSADGKQLRVLQEVTSEAGVYQFNWNTADLAAGMYYVTLLLDGEPITKRAVKIDR